MHLGVVSTWSTGHAALDACLAGGGWPLGGLVEVLQEAGGGPQAWSLVMPALRSWLGQAPPPGQAPRNRLVLVGPPGTPVAGGLAARGLAPVQWVQVQTPDPARRLWACEQALACSEVGGVLAWVPQASFLALRRLQLAAARHGGLLWVCRPASARAQPSPAVVRLALQVGAAPGHLAVQVLKHRGPPVPGPVDLPLADPAVQAWLAAARWRQAQRRQGAWPSVGAEPAHAADRLLDRVVVPHLAAAE